jgi:hypothetical protein
MKPRAILAFAAVIALLAVPASASESALKLKSHLTPDLVPGGGGDADGSGRANLALRPSARKVCYRISFSGLSDVTGAAIRVGRPNGTGGGRFEIDLFGKDKAGGPQPIHDCMKVADRPRGLRKIYSDSQRYYVQVDARGYKYGALRGRLEPIVIACGHSAGCTPPRP